MSTVPPFEADREGADYIYVALADHIQARIEAGELNPGRRLPAERDMAEEYGVAYLTVRRAMRELRERGLIRTVVGKGTFVVRPEPLGSEPAGGDPAAQESEPQGEDAET